MPYEPMRARESPRETVRARKGQKEPMITITRERARGSQRESEEPRKRQKLSQSDPRESQGEAEITSL